MRRLIGYWNGASRWSKFMPNHCNSFEVMETLISTTSVQSLNELQKSDYTRQSSRIVVSVIATRRHAPCLRRIAKTKRIFYELSCMTIAVPKCQQDNFSWQRLFWINGQSIHPNLDTIMKLFFLFELRNSIHGIGNGSTWSTGPCEMWRHVESLERIHDDVIKWKHFLRYWPLVRGIHQSPVNSLHKGQWHGALIFSLICAWANAWVNNRDAGDLRRHRAHYDVTVR